MVKKCQRRNVTIADVFQEYVLKTPEKPCLVFEDRSWTFREVDEFSNRMANVFHAHGYKRGDTVGLLMENRPEYVATWLGLSKIGVIVPMINNNLRQDSLLHSITVANCNALIFGESYLEGELFRYITVTLNRQRCHCTQYAYPCVWSWHEFIIVFRQQPTD